MSETNPTPGGNPPPPKTSGLAVWSLVLGILSLLCLPLVASIPGVICGHKALSRIKHSRGAVEGQGLAIAGLVTGYLGILWVIVFIPIMAAMLLPALARAKEKAQTISCINNLKEIQAAKMMWANDHHKQATDTPAESDLTPYLGANSARVLKCPAGGDYQINAVGEKPACSKPNHKIP